jgi:hypothetical protein
MTYRYRVLELCPYQCSGSFSRTLAPCFLTEFCGVFISSILCSIQTHYEELQFPVVKACNIYRYAKVHSAFGGYFRSGIYHQFGFGPRDDADIFPFYFLCRHLYSGQ